jgi:ankyrin repeat protein
MESGFIWADDYGLAEVADALLDTGVDVDKDRDTYRQHKLTGLHWAVARGDLNTVKAVLKHKAKLEASNLRDGTALGGWSGDPLVRGRLGRPARVSRAGQW